MIYSPRWDAPAFGHKPAFDQAQPQVEVVMHPVFVHRPSTIKLQYVNVRQCQSQFKDKRTMKQATMNAFSATSLMCSFSTRARNAFGASISMVHHLWNQAIPHSRR
jgi:hypothetical protein